MADREDWKRFVVEIRQRADLLALAEEGGLKPRKKGERGVALCPFHQDRRPSLHLYLEQDPHYHCFVCDAHGDAISLYQALNRLDFREARDHLASRYGIARPRGGNQSRTGADPLETAFSFYKSEADAESLKRWRTSRGLNAAVVRSQATVSGKDVLAREASRDPNVKELFRNAGLIVERRAEWKDSFQLPLPIDRSYRDFFAKPRILFAIRDLESQWVGLAGRALAPSDQPKYLFTPRLRTSRILYAADRVRRAIKEWQASGKDRLFRIFVVEGLIDVLRLEQLGLPAVALLGTGLSTRKIELLGDLAREVERRDGLLAVHVFLDADRAGISATARWLPRLLREASTVPYLVDVVRPPATSDSSELPGGDPDSLLRGVKRKEEAWNLVDSWSYSAVDGLLAYFLGCHPKELQDAWEVADRTEKIQVLREIERSVSAAPVGETPGSWRWIFDRIDPFVSALGVEAPNDASSQLRSFLGLGETEGEDLRLEAEAAESPGLAPADSANLSRAIQVARASTQRREFPTDHGAWQRMLAAESAFLHPLAGMLANRQPSGGWRPLMAIYLPKTDGRPRLKATPSPEVLVIQQYMLTELLRDGLEGSDFSAALPAVRHLGGSGRDDTWTTGIDLPKGEKVVSFAYQVRMDVVNGHADPGREGIFRPYFECWRDFVAYIDERVRRMPSPRIHAVRLDIRGFYDNVSRSAVLDVLKAGVDRALDCSSTKELIERAPLFTPKRMLDRRQRLSAIVDWLIKQSFDYSYLDPGSGEEISAGPQGVPQGPDLSSYLANISLFRLDERLSHLVRALDQDSEGAGPGWSATYARYVDDIVLVASTASDLRRLREAVEIELGKIGLELNDKSEPLPAMSVTKFRRWLTSQRGGLGVSDPFGEPNEEASLFRLGALADAGEVDRSQSLAIFYSPDLDHERVPWAEIKEQLRIALAAKDLRFGEYAAAARGLWRGVAESLEADRGTEVDVAQAAATFAALWREMNILMPPQLGEDSSTLQATLVANFPVIAALQGLERFLSRRNDQSFHFDRENRETLRGWRQGLAKLVVDGLVAELLKVLGSAGAERHLGHMLELRSQALLWIAIQVLGDLPGLRDSRALDSVSGSRFQTWARRSFLISNSVGRENIAKLDLAELRDDPWSLLHAAIGRLQGFDANTSPESGGLEDPLQPFRETVLSWKAGSESSNDGRELVSPILGYWIPDPVDLVFEEADGELASDALASLMNLAPRECGTLLNRRPQLIRDLLKDLGPVHENLKFLPALPGIGSPGVIGFSEGGNDVEGIELILIRRQGEEDSRRFLPELEWRELKKSELFCIERARLKPGTKILLPKNERPAADSKVLRDVAEYFEQLVAFSRRNEQEDGDHSWLVAPAAQNIFRTDGDSRSFGFLGFMARREYLDGSAFVRLGGSSYQRHPVPSSYADLWRVGVALSDFFGRADLIKGSESVRLSPNYLAIDENREDWIAEAMLRISLRRLSGYFQPSVGRVEGSKAEGDEFPRSIQWLLQRLVSFPQITDAKERRLAELLKTHVWGPAWRVRESFGQSIDTSLPGGSTALLAFVAPKYFLDDSRLAEDLPSVPRQEPAWHPRRRPAFAWFRVAQRLERLCESGTAEGDHDPSFIGLVSGIYLWSLNLELRGAVAEQVAAQPSGVLSDVEDPSPGLEVLGLDHSALLHAGQQPGNAVDGLRLILGLGGGDRRVPELRGATPLGALVALGVLTGVIPSSLKGRGLRGFEMASDGDVEQKKERAELVDKFWQVARDLAQLGNEESLDGPFDDLREVSRAWKRAGALRQPMELIQQVDRLAGIECLQASGEHSLGRRDGRLEFLSSRGTRQLESFQIVRSNLRDDGDWEAIESGQSVHRVWSESWIDDFLVGVGLIYKGLGRLAQTSLIGGLKQQPVESGPFVAPDSLRNSEDTSDASEELVVEPGLDGDLAETELSTDAIGEEPSPDSDKPPVVRPGGDDPDKIQSWQDVSWESRGKLRSRRHVRVALLQWFGGNSYEHPWFEALQSSLEGKSPPSQWSAESLASPIEYRRRKILERVLDTCNKLEVQALVIPEYTMRPETIQWLYETMHKATAPSTSIWCGTYRVPFGGKAFLGDQVVDQARLADRQHQALLTVLKAPERLGEARRIELRAKKYAAVSLGEELKPHRTELSALLADCNAADLPESVLFELICAEAFLAVSPTNLLALARESQRSWLRYGIPTDLGEPLENAVKMCKADMAALSKMTSLTECETPPRRSILLVPAMTTRIQDYALAGQSGFLANGISMALANAVWKNGGRSCFVGQNSWDVESLDPQPTDPYHGIQPGIYRQGSSEKGWLGRREEALIVADIDPDNSLGGRPSPEVLPPGLRLVAHVPILTSWSCRMVKKIPMVTPIKDWSSEYTRFRRTLAAALAVNHRTTMNDPSPLTLATALGDLKKLQEFSLAETSRPDWLGQRQQAYLEGHGLHPQQWPPPVALDFLCVDLGGVAEEKFPRIEVPASRAGNIEDEESGGK